MLKIKGEGKLLKFDFHKGDKMRIYILVSISETHGKKI